MKEKSKRMNAADWFLLLLALLSVCGILLRFWGMRNRSDEELQEYAVMAKWENADERTVSCLRAGDVLYTAGGERFGRVMSISSVPAEIELVSGGTVYRLPSESRVNATVEIAVLGRLSDGQLFKDGTDALAVGQARKLYSSMTELPLTVMFWDQEPTN